MCRRDGQIRTIDRKQEVPHEGAMCDLMWSEPEDINGWGMSPRCVQPQESDGETERVERRGAGYLFGPDITKNVNDANDIDFIARAHQVVMDGYKVMFNDKRVTVWSVPNYCYR